MIFVYKNWGKFCEKLKENGFYCIPAKDVSKQCKGYVVLKHDVETDVEKAYKLAEIECKAGHRGTYYIQAYLLHDLQNVELLKKMQEMGHEISYHYDVLDSCQGNLEKAILEFEENRKKFENYGFCIKTLCQHGNPIIERKGYTSNRDFFRSEKVQQLYPKLSDIMVNYKEAHQTEYLYFSDAGRQFKLIYDPLYNDIIKSDDKNIPYKNLEKLFGELNVSDNYIISIHPHRWTKSAGLYIVKTVIFLCVKNIAKIMMKIPFVEKLLSRYYYLAKKF